MEAKRKKGKPQEREHVAKVVAGVEGMALYIDDYRVAGPKPWDGGVVRHEFRFTDADLRGVSLLPGDKQGGCVRTLHIRRQQLGSCPCLHTTPCEPRCTCVVPLSSVGCTRCCSYGSPEEQRAAAERLVGKREEHAKVVQPDGYIVAEGSRSFCEGVLFALKTYTTSDAYGIVASSSVITPGPES